MNLGIPVGLGAKRTRIKPVEQCLLEDTGGHLELNLAAGLTTNERTKQNMTASLPPTTLLRQLSSRKETERLNDSLPPEEKKHKPRTDQIGETDMS
jgi:hypothetical protein